MQIRHARPGDEAQLALLLEEHERHYGQPVPEGAGAPGAAFLVDPPAHGTLCLVAEDDGRWPASPSSTRTSPRPG